MINIPVAVKTFALALTVALAVKTVNGCNWKKLCDNVLTNYLYPSRQATCRMMDVIMLLLTFCLLPTHKRKYESPTV